MSISSKWAKLKIIAGGLRDGRTVARAFELIREYGIKELLLRVRGRLRPQQAPAPGRLILTNESPIGDLSELSGFTVRQRVQFDILPGSKNVSCVEIATRCVKNGAVLTLIITDANGTELLSAQASEISNNDYTRFEFLPVTQFYEQTSRKTSRIRITITSDTPGCGVLVNKRSRKRAFHVQGGGSVACKVYARTDAEYAHWLANNTPTSEELEAQRSHTFGYSPKISIIVPLYNTPEDLFRELVDSVMAQTYPNWELCLGDGSTEQNDIAQIVQGYNDPRIKYQKLKENEGISGNTNRAIEFATGEYIALLDHDDTLMPQALYSYVRLINEDRDYDFIYSDEDKLSADGTRRFNPFFKPDFSPDMLLSLNYITHFTVIKRSLLDEIGYLDGSCNGAQDYDLFLRATEKAKKIGHIDDILYNWRTIPGSTASSAGAKSYTVSAGNRAVSAAIKRRGIDAHVEDTPLPNHYRVVYHIPTPHPKVSVIIPNHNNADMLRRCVDSIMRKSTYDNYEIVIVENNSKQHKLFSYYEQLRADSRVKLLEWNHPFNFAALNNYAASQTEGELILFLNNDMSIISEDWLEQMVMQACRKEIGAVGAKLLYPSGTVQHAGINLRVGGTAGHAHKHTPGVDFGYFSRLMVYANVSAVTAACLMVRREVFNEVNGFDEQFVVAYNDVDFCLRLREKGYYNLYTPYAVLYHYESKTRGFDTKPEKKARLEQESRLFLERWGEKYPYDPFYSSSLSKEVEDYSLNPARNEHIKRI